MLRGDHMTAWDRVLPGRHIHIYTLNYPQITALFNSRYQANPPFVATTTPFESHLDIYVPHS